MAARRANENARRAALALSHKFFGAAPRAVHKFDLVWPSELVALGKVGTVSYICDKEDSKLREWVHRFKPGSVLLAAAKPVGRRPYRSMLVIIGNFEITNRGIIG